LFEEVGRRARKNARFRVTRSRPSTMPRTLNRSPLALLACLLLAGAAAAARAPSAGSAGAGGLPEGPGGPAEGPGGLPEGPGGRVQLTRWTLRADPADRGLARGWQRGGFAGRSVSVPDDVDPDHYSGRAGARNYEGSVAWYRTSFQAGEAGEYALDFESANYQASVWVDGHALGAHRGSYLPFELRARVAAGAHTLVVRIDWRDPTAQARAGFHRTWFNWGGLNGRVYARALGASDLSAPSVQTTLAPDGSATVRVSVQVRNDGPARSVQPQGALSRSGQSVVLPFPALALEHGATATASATVTVPQPALWSPGAPNLYALSLAVAGESSYSARVGLRQLSWHGGRLLLNGRRVLLHGATIQTNASGHGDALTPSDEAAIVSRLKALGANAVRAQHPLDPALLERLDAAGMLVWQGVGPVEGAGNWYSNTPTLLAAAERQARTAVLAAQLHPSIFAWNLVDEVAGNGHDGYEIAYVRDMARLLRAHDPGRMVGVDVWGDHPPKRAGALYAQADAVAETDYSGWYDSPRSSPAQLRAQMRARLRAMERTFAGKVLVISEFGAEANRLNPPGSPGSYSFQARVLAAHISVYAADPRLTAMFVWLLSDYPLTPAFEGGSIHNVLPHVRLIEGINQKGLFTYAGRPKSAAGVVGRLYRALP
jgi:Glycosyl hydrolases family 2, TIM barrel domain/Glycosyl hydrolases family 2/Glycosyl hydrolases family 2, sugar binding domain